MRASKAKRAMKRTKNCRTHVKERKNKTRISQSSCDDNGATAFDRVSEIVSPHKEALTKFYRNELDDESLARIKEDARVQLESLGSDIVRIALEHQAKYCRRRAREHRSQANNIIRHCARAIGVSLGKEVEESRRKKHETVWHKGRKEITEEIVEAIRQKSFRLPAWTCGTVHKRTSR